MMSVHMEMEKELETDFASTPGVVVRRLTTTNVYNGDVVTAQQHVFRKASF